MRPILFLAVWVLSQLGFTPLSPAVAAAPPSAREDARLAQTVELAQPRVYLGEAVEELSRSSGVALRVRDVRDDAGSGLELVFYVRGRPLAEVMAGLATLLTSPYDRWSWRRRGEGEKTEYILQHTRSLIEAQAAAYADVERRMHENVLTLYRAARRGPGALRALRGARPHLAPYRDDRGWAMLGLLGELNPGQVDGLLRGFELVMPTGLLSPRGIDNLHGAMGPRAAPPPGGVVRFSTQPERGLPHLSIDIETAREVWVGGAGLDDRWHRQAWSGWSNAGTAAQKEEEARIWAAIEARKSERQHPRAAVPELLRRIAAEHGFSFIAEVNSLSVGGGLSADRTLEEMLYLLGARFRDWPWRKEGDLYLFRRADAWFIRRDGVVPWLEIKALRHAAKENEGFLDVEALARIARMRPEQRQHLVEEFPNAEPGLMETWRPIFLLPEAIDPRWRRDLKSGGSVSARVVIREAGKLLFPPGQKPGWPGAELVAGDPDAMVMLLEEIGSEKPAIVWRLRWGESPPKDHTFRLRERRPLRLPQPQSPPPRRPASSPPPATPPR